MTTRIDEKAVDELLACSGVPWAFEGQELAADAIRALRSERDRLREQKKYHEDRANDAMTVIQAKDAEIARIKQGAVIQLNAEIERTEKAEREAEALRKDAERYLADLQCIRLAFEITSYAWKDSVFKVVDAAIDAAIAQEGK